MSVAEPLEQEGLEDNKFTAIYIAVLAVLIAICSIGDDDASKTMIRSSVGAADTYAFFQAKNIRQTGYALAADAFEAELAKPGTDGLRGTSCRTSSENTAPRSRATKANRRRATARRSCSPRQRPGGGTRSCAPARSLFRLRPGPAADRHRARLGLAHSGRHDPALGERRHGHPRRAVDLQCFRAAGGAAIPELRRSRRPTPACAREIRPAAPFRFKSKRPALVAPAVRAGPTRLTFRDRSTVTRLGPG